MARTVPRGGVGEARADAGRRGILAAMSVVARPHPGTWKFIAGAGGFAQVWFLCLVLGDLPNRPPAWCWVVAALLFGGTALLAAHHRLRQTRLEGGEIVDHGGIFGERRLPLDEVLRVGWWDEQMQREVNRVAVIEFSNDREVCLADTWWGVNGLVTSVRRALTAQGGVRSSVYRQDAHRDAPRQGESVVVRRAGVTIVRRWVG